MLNQSSHDHTVRTRDIRVSMTGGGAHKFARWLETHPGVRKPFAVESRDEMQSLVVGLHFLLTRVCGECFSYPVERELLQQQEQQGQPQPYTMGPHAPRLEAEYLPAPFQPTDPYLLVNVGTGVSILKVEADGRRYERVSGSALGGGTYWGASPYTHQSHICSQTDRHAPLLNQ